MTRLLHIQCSPRKQRSASLEVARSFIAAYQQQRPDTEVVTLDLWAMALPEFDQVAMDAKYAGLNGNRRSAAEDSAWGLLQSLAQPLHDADLLLFSVPLWNYGIPYKLKHFIDLVSQKDILFSFSAERGIEGLLQDKTAVLAYARGLDFSAQSATPAALFDFQRPYMEAWLRLVGVTDLHGLVVEKTLLGDALDRTARHSANQQAWELAKRLQPCSRPVFL
ncbi:MAG: NAD(P)H-dependent oxidoreductase [Pseudomonas sp.]|uniref:FMN-dependent NADH-azoreductase n=1 Tax=Pseudomonas sp. TaxID=306 RepID=UPI00339537B9